MSIGLHVHVHVHFSFLSNVFVGEVRLRSYGIFEVRRNRKVRRAPTVRLGCMYV